MTQHTEVQIELSEELSRYLHAPGRKPSGLELIRGLPGLQAHARGNRLSLSGTEDSLARCRRFLTILADRLASGQDLDPQELGHLFAEFAGPQSQELHQDRQTGFHDILVTHSGRKVRPKTQRQQEYVEAIRTRDAVISIGPAGTGKTYLAVAMAVKALRDKQVSRIILSRPTIEAGEKLGFLPGDLLEKVDPHFRPLYDALHEFLGISRFQQLLRQGVIEITPLAYMRGRTFNEAFIVLDEAQNTTVPQMRMFLTRMGYGSRVVVTGDRTQIDLPNRRDSSLLTLPEVLHDVERIGFITLEERDVVRHELVRDIIRAYEAYYGDTNAEGSETARQKRSRPGSEDTTA
ncbi:MAG TPA: PhoH family protein [Candidatus Ozemobacteraceae bacterium]|nr:PhoH family protein [Candidatus Ozemobacteraceae bacterium]